MDSPSATPHLECVVNVSEGTRTDVVDAIAGAAGGDLLDVHSDRHHNRSVLTLVGEDAPRAVARAAVERLDLRRHQGVHPRIGVVDVVPFVPLAGATLADAVAARNRFLAWIAAELGVPGFAYGPERTLPEVRRHAFAGLTPDAGPLRPHLSAGAVAVGERVQVSLNLVEPTTVGPAEAWDRVAARVPVAGAELVGLIPQAVLDRTDPARWPQLDLAPDRTIEARLALREARDR